MLKKNSFRKQRIGEQMQRVIAECLQFEVKDPRVQGITIVDVEINKDLSFAKVFYTLLDEAELPRVEQGLTKCAGFLRAKVGSELSLRHTPELRFTYDKSMVHGYQMSQLIDQAIASDKAKQSNSDN